MLYDDGYLMLDTDRWLVSLSGKRLKLTPTEFRLLATLMENQNRVLSRTEILHRVWGPEYINDLDYTRVYIWHLRNKIEPQPSQPRYIQTENGVGYRFVPQPAVQTTKTTHVAGLQQILNLFIPLPPWQGLPLTHTIALTWRTAWEIVSGQTSLVVTCQREHPA